MKKKISSKSVLFPNKRNLGHRNWGSETLLVLIPKILSLKILKMKKGSKGGLQYHHKKNECGYVISGKLKVKYDNGKGKLIEKMLKKGDSFHFPPGAIHQEEAITECEIIEASSPHFNDRVREEKLYGLKEAKGLKSTSKGQVKIR